MILLLVGRWRLADSTSDERSLGDQDHTRERGLAGRNPQRERLGLRMAGQVTDRDDYRGTGASAPITPSDREDRRASAGRDRVHADDSRGRYHRTARQVVGVEGLTGEVFITWSR